MAGCVRSCCSPKVIEINCGSKGCCTTKSNAGQEGIAPTSPVAPTRPVPARMDSPPKTSVVGGSEQAPSCDRDLAAMELGAVTPEKSCKPLSPEEEKWWSKFAVALAAFTVVWNVAEGLVSIAFGISEESLALASFGADSFIEVFSSLVVLWHLCATLLQKDTTEASKHALIEKERTATRIIGVLTLLLAMTAAGVGIFNLVHGNQPSSSVPGLLIAAVSLSFMFFLWAEKRKAALKLKSRALLADSRCALGCIELSAALMLGSVIYLATDKLWFIDSVVAIIMSALIAKDGIGALKAASSPDFEGGCAGCCG